MANTVANPVYLVSILNETTGTNIIANLPENFSLGTRADWQSRTASVGEIATDVLSSVGAPLAGAFGGVAINALNANALIKPLTWQTWSGSGPLSFPLDLLFDAKEDAYQDVVKPMLELAAMCCPSENGVFLLPPGPSIIYPDQERISLLIGDFMYIHSVIICDVNLSFDTRMDPYGNPISGQAQVTLQTINTPSRQEFISFFLRTNGTRNTGYGVKTGLEEYL